jgi:hypothetical protein
MKKRWSVLRERGEETPYRRDRRQPNPEGMQAALAAHTVDRQTAYCAHCGAELHIDTDRAGRHIDMEYIGGPHPRMIVHRCRRGPT